MKHKKNLILLFAAAMLCLICSGCWTTEGESDIPWNTPQSWETGSPYFPSR